MCIIKTAYRDFKGAPQSKISRMAKFGCEMLHKYGKHSLAKFVNFVYICTTREKLATFPSI